MRKLLIKIILILALFGAVVGYWGYNQIFSENTNHTEPQELFIPSNSNFEDLIRILSKGQIIKSVSSFRRVSSWMKYSNVKPGRYIIEPDLNNRKIISLLRSGKQEPVDVTISTARTINDVIKIVHPKIEPDSMQLLTFFHDKEWLEKNKLSNESLIGIIIPNTYEFYWNTTAEQFAERMLMEFEDFWNDNRSSALSKLNLKRNEIATLASIVEKESIQKEERKIIAGVYLNRLERGIPLQADPTVVFGVGDYTIRRVLNRHLEFDSPYNTYLYKGLPPGPICMPSISSIDAVLFPEKHDYLFFCAKPGYNGSHAFAKTNAGHERNARIYQRWLNSEGIRR